MRAGRVKEIDSRCRHGASIVLMPRGVWMMASDDREYACSFSKLGPLGFVGGLDRLRIKF